MNKFLASCFFVVLFSLVTFSISLADTVTAWGTIGIKDQAMGADVTNAEIKLSCAPNQVKRGAWNKFKFHNVPCDEGCRLTISIQSPTSGKEVIYNGSYRFHSPSILGGIRAKKSAGYLGDFKYVIKSERIIRNSRY